MAKGSWSRVTNLSKYGENYDRIFGKKEDVENVEESRKESDCRNSDSECVQRQSE